jgi:HK97 family phage portal protein
MSFSQLIRANRRATKWNIGHPRDPILKGIFGGGTETRAKVDVTVSSAHKLAAVYACIRTISETKAALPLHVFQTTKGGTTQRIRSHPVAEMFHNFGPNKTQTPMVFAETRQQHALSWGNSYAELLFGGSDIQSIRLIDPWRVTIEFRDGEQWYKVSQDSGGDRWLDISQVLHIPAYGNGTLGWSPIELHAETIGTGLAMVRYGGAFFGNSARASVVVEFPGKLGDKAYDRLKKEVTENLTGDNAHKPFLAEGGMKLHPISIPNNEAQYIEASELNGEDICRIYRVPPHIVGYLRRATFDNITAQDQSFEKHTMQPWLVRDEQEIRKKLFTPAERAAGMFVKHNVDALLRSDIETRYKSYQVAIQGGWMNFDEARALEDLNPLPDGQGQTYIIPMNMQALEDIKKPKGIMPTQSRDDTLALFRGCSTPGPTTTTGCTDTADDESQTQVRALLLESLTGLVGREIECARAAAKNPGKFYGWIGSFYHDHAKLMASRLRSVEDPDNHIAGYIDRSQKRWLALTDNVVLSTVKPDEFITMVEHVLNDHFNGVAATLTDQLVGE